MKRYQVHEITGRIRVRLPSLKGETPASDTLVGEMRSLEGVRSVCINHTTGSLIVKYNPKITNSHAVYNTILSNGFKELLVEEPGQSQNGIRAKARAAIAQVAWGILMEKSIYGLALIVTGRSGFSEAINKYKTDGSYFSPIQLLKQIFDGMK
jgi:hypothetical protein